MDISEMLINAVSPNVCLGCGEIVCETEHLCFYCHELISKTADSNYCVKCGNDKKNCKCTKNVWFYKGVAAPYYNEGLAREIMYRYKFSRQEYIAEFFAKQIALAVKQYYFDLSFDILCYVPLYFTNKLRRGYNQSELIAKELGKLLNVPVASKALKCKRRSSLQHETPIEKRVENVKDKYSCNYNLRGKRVLLIDDIKTTGATLNECAKELMRAGADCVYCATGLVTPKKSQERKK